MRFPFRTLCDFNQLKLGLCPSLPQFYTEFSAQAPSQTFLNLKVSPILPSGETLLWERAPYLLQVINPSFSLPSPSKKEKGSEALQL